MTCLVQYCLFKNTPPSVQAFIEDKSTKKTSCKHRKAMASMHRNTCPAITKIGVVIEKSGTAMESWRGATALHNNSGMHTRARTRERGIWGGGGTVPVSI